MKGHINAAIRIAHERGYRAWYAHGNGERDNPISEAYDKLLETLELALDQLIEAEQLELQDDNSVMLEEGI